MTIEHTGRRVGIRNRLDFINKPIESKGDAIAFITSLDSEGCLFHLDDAPAFIVDQNGNWVFSVEEAEMIIERVGECFSFHEDPFEICVELLGL